MPSEKTHTLRSILTLTFARLIVNITRRFSYPFLPEIARSFDVPLQQVQSVVAAQTGIGLGSPLTGSLADQIGRRRVMLSVLAVMLVATIAGAVFESFVVFIVVMITLGIVKMMFDPAALAYLADVVPYERRAMALGFTELAWAGSLFVAAPVAGFLLAEAGLSAVFILLAILAVPAFAAIWWLVPDDSGHFSDKRRPFAPVQALRTIAAHRAARGAVGYTFLLVAANEMIFISYAAWLEKTFDLTITTLGAVSLVIAAAEVLGEFGVIGFADRLGKKRMAVGGALLASLAYGLMPLFDFSLALALASLFAMFIGVETAIVASVPLFSEVLPDDRAVMLSGIVAAGSSGRMGGGVIGGLLYAAFGLGFAGMTSLVVSVAAIAILLRFVPDQHRRRD